MSHRFIPARGSLHELLPGPEGLALDSHLARLEITVAEIEVTRARLSSDLATTEFLELLHRDEAISSISARLGAYAYLWFAADTHNPAAPDLRGRIKGLKTIG